MVHASLFSGIGGPEVAAAMLGWCNAFHCEINPFGKAVLEYWFPDSVSYEDITKTDFTEWRGRIDVLTGGFPCQPFSYAGERRGAADERYLWPEMLRAIDEARPTWVVGENVAGLQTMVEGGILTDLGCEATLFQEGDPVHGYTLEQSFTIERICRDLEHIGYSVQPMLIPAAAVGAPHRRDRIFIVAYTDGSREGASRESGSTQGGGRYSNQLQSERGTEAERDNRLSPFQGTSTDSNRSDDLREARGYESQSGEERLPERNAIRVSGEPDNVRPEVCGSSTDSECVRCEELGELRVHGRRDSRSRGDSRTQQTEEGRCAPNPDCGRLEGTTEIGGRPVDALRSDRGSGEGGIAPNTLRIGWVEGTNDNGVFAAARQGECRELEFGGTDCPQDRWRKFPTVSPVHRGNDGLPFSLDDLTISASKWRTEALKAYGNAIVPQVMYEIFRAIEQVENDAL